MSRILSPTALLLITTLQIVLGQNLYFYLNHPIQWVRLVGVVVAVDVYPTRWILLLDDSSGATLEVTCGRPTFQSKNEEPALPADSSKVSSVHDPPTEGLTATGRSIDLGAVDVGTVVKAKGGIGTFRGEKQLLLERISIVYTTNEEITAWTENADFRKDVLDEPWFVSKKDEERARKKAEGLDRNREETSKEKNKRRRTTDSRLPNNPNNSGARRIPARQEKKGNGIVDNTAAKKGKAESQRIKRAKDKKLREKEFEKLKVQKENVNPVLNKPLGNGVESVQGKAGATVETSQKPEGDVPNDAQFDKKEQARLRRAEERRLRELEFQRLQRVKDTRGA